MTTPKEKVKAPSVLQMFGDLTVPAKQRQQVLQAILHDPSEEMAIVHEAILTALANPQAESVYTAKTKELAELMHEIKSGPLRYGMFVQMDESAGSVRRAQVLLEDGTTIFAAVPDAAVEKTLRCGDGVLLEAQGRALVGRAAAIDETGEIAMLERRIDSRRVEVTLHGQERMVFRVAAALSAKLDAGEAAPGRQVRVLPRQRIAFDVLPPTDGLSHFRFLVREPVPNVVVERDIGAPPRYINQLTEILQLEMLQPELRRRYRLPRCTMKLLTGVSGSGKTLSLLACWRRMYELMSDVTGVPIAELPPRVLRLRMAEVLSPWLGESDKNLDRFFTEVLQVADEKFVAPDGRSHVLPVLAIIEEADGLARQRGQDHDAVFDRILTTALQRLDPTHAELRDRLVVFMGSTNLIQHLDTAFIRRIGGTVEKFGRLTRQSFVAVLTKHLGGLPLASNNGCTEDELRQRIVSELTTWLFSPNGADEGVIEVTYAGSVNPERRYKRELLTGGLVQRAVQQAAEEACQAHKRDGTGGLTTALLAGALDQQLRSIVDQLTEHNLTHHLTVPDAVHVASVRRLPQPSVNPFALQRNAHERS